MAEESKRERAVAVPGGGLALLCLVCVALVMAGCIFVPSEIIPAWPSPPASPAPERTEARVVYVVDGDTIRVRIEGETVTLRYIGIDTPETVHPERPVEWMGPEATAANERLVGGKTVYLEKDVSEIDRYGRLLRYVFLADGTFINGELVRRGYAVASTYPPDVKYQELLRRWEQEAREAGRGLWGTRPTATPTAPAAGKVVIVEIVYDGEVDPEEPDEYCQIRNEGEAAANLAGWRLNAGAEGQDFLFPEYVLRPGQSCRVYTNEVHPESGGFSFGSEQALWRNGGDCGYLYDAEGALVSERCY